MKYYLHSTISFEDEKVAELFLEFGYEGLGLFYTLLEKIALQEKPVKTLVLKSQLKVGKKLEKCWKFMEQIGLISSNNGETFNKQLLNFSEKYTIKKQKNAERIKQWRDNQEDTKNVTRSESVRNAPKVNRSKVNRSKVNRSKVNKEKEKEVFFELIFPFEDESFKNLWDVWKKYKKEQHNFIYKGEISEQAALKELGELAKGSLPLALKLIENAISHGWKGIFEIKSAGKKSSGYSDDELFNAVLKQNADSEQ